MHLNCIFTSRLQGVGSWHFDKLSDRSWELALRQAQVAPKRLIKLCVLNAQQITHF
jgi:hypothetical protein